MRTLALVLFALGTASCHSNSDEILIGEVEAMTGSEAAFGTSTHMGLELAVAEINAAGGIHGKKLKLLTLDDQGKPEEAALAVTKLITQDGAQVVISGSNSTRCLAMVPIAQNHHIPFVATGATNPKVTAQGDYIFRTTFIDPFQGVVMANFTTKTLGFKHVAILKDMKSDYSIGLAEYFANTFKKEGGTITIEQTYSFGEVDFKSQLTSIMSTKPDAIFIPGYYTEVALIARQAHEQGVHAVLLGADGWDSPKLKEIAGTSIAGGYFSAQYSPESTEEPVRRFMSTFKTHFGIAPDASCALGYDGGKILGDAMGRAKELTAASIRDALAATRDFQGATGKIRIDENRNAIKSAAVIKIDAKGDFRFHSSVAPGN